MQKGTKSIAFIIIGLIGFFAFTFFSLPNSTLTEACKTVILGDDPSATVDGRLLEQCERDRGFALMMTLESPDPQAVAKSNQFEVLIDMLSWFFLGIGIVGFLTLFLKRN